MVKKFSEYGHCFRHNGTCDEYRNVFNELNEKKLKKFVNSNCKNCINFQRKLV